ncbi:MAG: hypothetical protein ABI555_01640 [Chloroflexota bacterium]
MAALRSAGEDFGMVRHMVRLVIKSGQWDAFLAAHTAWNEVAVTLGLPAYKVYSSDWGTFSEAFSEGEYQSSGDIEARFNAVQKDAKYRAAMTALSQHFVDGQSRDYVLSEEIAD